MKKTFAAVAAFAMAAFISVPASAITLDATNNIMDGGSYNLSAGPFTWGADFIGGDPGASVSFTFTNDVVAAGADSIGTVLQGVGSFAGGVMFAWAAGESVTIPAAAPTGGFSIYTAIAFGMSDVLTVSWGAVSGSFADIDFVVTAIPLPAGLLLILTAFAGLAVVGRPRHKATAV